MMRADVIGDPIAQSKSPLIHRYWAGELGLNATYDRVHLTQAELPGYFTRALADPAWRGCNVTLPHKLAVMELVGDPGGVRDSIGAMNTVLRAADGTLTGTNTDAAGFYDPLHGLDLTGKPVVVVGAGGAARAVLFALARLDVGPVTILNRNVLKAAGLLATFGLKGRALPLDAALPRAALLVNASALGMVGHPPLALDLSPLPDDAVVYDLVYAPLETALLAAAQARGLDTVDGLEMLVGQAALAFELFFGVAPPRDEARETALRALLTA